MTPRVLYLRVLLQGSTKTAKSSISWQVQPSSLTNNLLTGSFWSQAETRAGLNLPEGTHHPKVPLQGMKHHRFPGEWLFHWEKSLQCSVDRVTSHWRVLRRSQAHGKRYLCIFLITWMGAEACPWRDDGTPAARWGLVPYTRAVMWQPLITPQCSSLHNEGWKLESFFSFTSFCQYIWGQTQSTAFLLSATTAALPV